MCFHYRSASLNYFAFKCKKCKNDKSIKSNTLYTVLWIFIPANFVMLFLNQKLHHINIFCYKLHIWVNVYCHFHMLFSDDCLCKHSPNWTHTWKCYISVVKEVSGGCSTFNTRCFKCRGWHANKHVNIKFTASCPVNLCSCTEEHSHIVQSLLRVASCHLDWGHQLGYFLKSKLW